MKRKVYRATGLFTAGGPPPLMLERYAWNSLLRACVAELPPGPWKEFSRSFIKDGFDHTSGIWVWDGPNGVRLTFHLERVQ